MIYTAITHASIAAIVSLIGLALGSLPVGIAVALGFYLGREVAQHERKTPGTNPVRGFFVWNWSTDAKLDLLFPAIACALIAFAVVMIKDFI